MEDAYKLEIYGLSNGDATIIVSTQSGGISNFGQSSPPNETETAVTRAEIIDYIKKQTALTVQAGIFKGMSLDEGYSWGNGFDLAPQLLGVYEEELYPTLAIFSDRKYAFVANVGCAEGYFAVGLALLFPRIPVHAFDVNESAQVLTHRNAVTNRVDARLFIHGACDVNSILELQTPPQRALWFVDCEGYEKELLGSRTVSDSLRNSDLIVECHDFVDRTTTSTVMRNLSTTHRFSIIQGGGRNPSAFPFLNRLTDEERWLAICENRPELMHWLVCEAIDRLVYS